MKLAPFIRVSGSLGLCRKVYLIPNTVVIVFDWSGLLSGAPFECGCSKLLTSVCQSLVNLTGLELQLYSFRLNIFFQMVDLLPPELKLAW